ncbi:uncharacterized protein LOC134283859 [Saccostrea cucullata]|uniref:uncharacterized protein LOC134283859 n=1 Tax=Saccostrea cuccullata TaxID=36930 RepID=UPI002ED2B438
MEADEAWVGNVSERPLKLFITTASEVPVNVNVSAPMAKTLYHGNRFTVKKGTIKQISIPKSLRVKGTKLAKKAIHIVSSDEIVVFGINQATYSTDGFLGIPVDVLGTKYFVPSFYSTAQKFYQSAVLVVGTQDNTKLNIKLPMKHKINIHLAGKSYNQGDWINITINKFDTLQLLCHADLTGTLVLSSEKVSVFGGSTVTSIGIGFSRDHIEEQIPPVNVWGKRFAVNPFPDTEPNILRFLASEDNTTVVIDNKNIHIMAGNFHETHVNRFVFISSNKPILSVQYVPSGTCIDFFPLPGCHKGDPAMALIPPIEQSNILYSFLTPVSSKNLNFNNIFMFVIEDSHENGLLLDNKHIRRRDFHSIVHRHNLTAGYLQIPPGSHTIQHSSKTLPFGGILYGGIQYESYAFPVGQRFATINKKECRPTIMDIGDGVDNDCDGQVDEEICDDSKDNDKDGRMDEDCLIKLSISTPLATDSKSNTATKILYLKATATTTWKRTLTSLPTTKATLIPTPTTLSPTRKEDTHISEDPRHPVWLSYTEYGIIGGVTLVAFGAISLCCKKCLGLLAKRDDDDEEEEKQEEYRRKMYKKARQAFGAPAIRPL